MATSLMRFPKSGPRLRKQVDHGVQIAFLSAQDNLLCFVVFAPFGVLQNVIGDGVDAAVRESRIDTSPKQTQCLPICSCSTTSQTHIRWDPAPT